MATSLFSLRRVLDASWALLAVATLFALSTATLVPQYGQVLVFCSGLASKSPPHLGQVTTRNDMVLSPSESLFHLLLNNG